MVVFAAALFFFGQQLESDVYEEGTVVNMGKESLPYLTLTSQNIKMNRLYGYNGPIEDNIVRESITPLDTGKKIRSIQGYMNWKFFWIIVLRPAQNTFYP